FAETIASALPEFLALFGIFQLILGIGADVADLFHRGLTVVTDSPLDQRGAAIERRLFAIPVAGDTATNGRWVGRCLSFGGLPICAGSEPLTGYLLSKNFISRGFANPRPLTWRRRLARKLSGIAFSRPAPRPCEISPNGGLSRTREPDGLPSRHI